MLIKNNDRINSRALTYIIDGMVARAEKGLLDEADYELMNKLKIVELVEDHLYGRAGDKDTAINFFDNLYPNLQAKKLIFEK